MGSEADGLIPPPLALHPLLDLRVYRVGPHPRFTFTLCRCVCVITAMMVLKCSILDVMRKGRADATKQGSKARLRLALFCDLSARFGTGLPCRAKAGWYKDLFCSSVQGLDLACLALSARFGTGLPCRAKARLVQRLALFLSARFGLGLPSPYVCAMQFKHCCA